MSVVRRYCSLTSKLWLPSPSAEKPIRFMSSIVGLSPKAFEIGGGAPPPAPAQGVGGLGEGHELAVVVGDVQDLDGAKIPSLLRDLEQNPTARVLRAGDVHQVGDRRREVGRA